MKQNFAIFDGAEKLTEVEASTKADALRKLAAIAPGSYTPDQLRALRVIPTGRRYGI